MSNDDTAFKPFVPPAPMIEEGKDSDTSVKPRRTRRAQGAISATGHQRKKSGKKRRQPKAGKSRIPPAPKHQRPKRKKKKKKKKKKRAATKTAHDKKLRTARITVYAVKDRKVVGKTRALKLDLAGAMAISALLKPADFKMFESLTDTLQSVNKATRKRLLAAISKVFS